MSKTGSKPTIAVDIDDVLAANAAGFAEYSNKKWGTRLTPDDYSEHWAEIWNVDYEEELRRRDEVVKDKLFVSYGFFNEAKPVLAKLSKKYRLVIATSTSRSSDVSDDTGEWIEKEFPGVFSEMYFATIWNDLKLHTLEKLKMTKADLVEQARAKYFIDDQPKHCFAAAELGVKSILFGDYKWNRSVELPNGVYRVKTWQAIEEFFDAEG